jgi:hypothetical protein
MYSVDNSRDKILTVDMNTGQATPFADLDRGVGGLTFDPRSGLLIAAFNFNDGEAGGQQIVTPAHTANITPQNHVLASP